MLNHCRINQIYKMNDEVEKKVALWEVIRDRRKDDLHSKHIIQKGDVRHCNYNKQLYRYSN